MKPRTLAILVAAAVVSALVLIFGFTAMEYRATELLGVLFLLAGVLIQRYAWHRYLAVLLLITLPFSVDIPFGSFHVSFPAEPLAALAAFVTLIWLVAEPAWIKVWWRQPIHKAAVLFPAVMAVGVLVSPMFRVSAKFAIVNSTFFVAGGVYFYLLFVRDIISPKRVLQILSLAFSVVVLYGFSRLVSYGFAPAAAPVAGKPFFTDHTVFSATLGLITPFLLLAIFMKKGKNRWLYIGFGVALLVFIFMLSSRATWLGLVAAAVLAALMFSGLTAGRFLVLVGVVAVLAAVYSPAIITELSANRNDSDAYDATLEEQALSVTNITSDVSNLERINRWKCAVRMGRERPLFGYGPGTYQFSYLPFQVSTEMTRISVVTPFNHRPGTGGTAHSEWLLAFSEMGWPGLLAWATLMLTIFYQGIRAFASGQLRADKKWILLAALLGFTTYFVHSFFNNFLNIPQFGLLFWLLLAVIAFYSGNLKLQHEPR